MAGMLVTGHGYWQLSNYFSDGPIPHRVRVLVRPAVVGRRSNAHYDRDVIRVKSADVLRTLSGRATVVHECTHAQFDLRALHSPIRSEEGAAFIAKAIYMLACNADIQEIDDAVTSEIREIAESVLASYRITRSTVQLTQDEIDIVRRVMVHDFRYRNGHYTNNGISGQIYRGL